MLGEGFLSAEQIDDILETLNNQLLYVLSVGR
jgi:hypothetical protein